MSVLDGTVFGMTDDPRPRGPQRVTVAVIFGGRSNEHAVSCVSARHVLRSLDPARFEAVPICISRDGQWFLLDAADAAGYQAEALSEVAATGIPVVLAPGSAAVVRRGGVSAGEPVDIDVVFPVLHGPYGEDGTVQGLLEMLGVPYVGAGVLASAVGMDKEFMKNLLAVAGLPVGDHVVLRPGVATVAEVDRRRLGLPVFVKPARGGSSIGISMVESWEGLAEAVATARVHDPKVIVEAAIAGREIECGVLEFPEGRVEASLVAEIRMPEGEDAPRFYDFDTKYVDDVCEFDLPAKLDDDVCEQIRTLAVSAFEALGCQGMARVDFFVTDEGPVVNEINTVPGFTPISLYSRAWEASGIGNRELVTTLIDTALARGIGLR